MGSIAGWLLVASAPIVHRYRLSEANQIYKLEPDSEGDASVKVKFKWHPVEVNKELRAWWLAPER
jgi:hypothetical protein